MNKKKKIQEINNIIRKHIKKIREDYKKPLF